MTRALYLLLLALPALAQSTPPAPPPPLPESSTSAPVVTTDETAKTSVLKPLHVDARFSADADILLIYVNLSLGADVGLIPAGPGTLAVGGAFELGFCGSACLALSALLSSAFNKPTGYGQQFYYPHARLSYHLDLPAVMKGSSSANNRTLEKLDLYGLLFGGPVFTHLGLATNDNQLIIEGNDVSFGIGGGIGANYFFTEHFFVGAEAAARYARGTYTWRAVAGSYQLSATEASWSASGLGVRFAVGARFP